MSNRSKKEISLGDRTVTIQEISVGDLRTLMVSGHKIEEMAPQDLIQTLLPLVCNLSLAELDDLLLSELVTLWKALVDINPGFFELARMTGLSRMAAEQLETVKETLLEILKEDFADLSAEGTPTPPNTD
jgi:hypothetical protein